MKHLALLATMFALLATAGFVSGDINDMVGLRFLYKGNELASAFGTVLKPIEFNLKDKTVYLTPIVKDRKNQVVEISVSEDREGTRILEKLTVSGEREGKITVMPVEVTVRLIEISRQK